jgi:hypothetical protein
VISVWSRERKTVFMSEGANWSRHLPTVYILAPSRRACIR